MAAKFRVGDKVLVIAGGCKGQTSSILQINQDRVFLDGVNSQVKHAKGRKKGEGKLQKVLGSIHVSNISHLDSNGKPSRVGFVIKRENNVSKKFLVLKNTGEEVRKI